MLLLCKFPLHQPRSLCLAIFLNVSLLFLCQSFRIYLRDMGLKAFSMVLGLFPEPFAIDSLDATSCYVGGLLKFSARTVKRLTKVPRKI